MQKDRTLTTPIKVEVVAIGTELTSGQKLDTNSQWLSQMMTSLGYHVAFHTTIADDFDDNVEAMARAVQRAQIILVTGGLGPTQDDLTRDVLAKIGDVPLALHQPSLDHILAMFAKRNRVCPERNHVQAMMPIGAEPIANEHGTAPGIWFEVAGVPIICMPGVPSEMKPMFELLVKPKLLARFGQGHAIVFRVINTFGEGESAIEAKLGDLIKRGRVPEVGITASQATISLRIKGEGETPELAWLATEPDAKFICQTLGDLVYGEGDEQLHQVVLKLLLEQKKTVSVAESCTGGLLGKLLTDEGGSSAAFQGGVIAYHNVIKYELLGVSNEILNTHGAVSQECAAAMATGCRARFKTDFALSITGIAGPGGGSDEKPVGLVYVALADETGVTVGQYNWPADRSAVRSRSAKTALNMLRRKLLASG